ncbi:MAG TPA: membrane protein insertion efficiency factor YidD [Puia sp.]|jgi:putative component of membrane protein insertase Oxa1/YidC/SpoIIIJ protein YidD
MATPLSRPRRRILVSFFAALLLTAGLGASAQTAGDLRLVGDRHFGSPDEFAHYHGAGNSEQVLQNRHQSFIAQYNPVSLVLKGALLGYQKLVSEQLARSCPYEITCSNFSKQSIRDYGIFKGVFISADRILRCNRIALLDVSPLNINPASGAIIDSPNMYR